MLTLRVPATPLNGARNCVLASRASASARAARATSRLATASSRAAALTKPRAARSVLRLRSASASVRLARACCSSARAMESSRPTMTVPRLTCAPSRKAIVAIRPDTSGRTTTASAERRVPTASSTSGIAPLLTEASSTATGGGPSASGLACPAAAPPGCPACGALAATGARVVCCCQYQTPAPSASRANTLTIVTARPLATLSSPWSRHRRRRAARCGRSRAPFRPTRPATRAPCRRARRPPPPSCRCHS